MKHVHLKAIGILLLLRPASAKESYEFEYAGKLYGTLDKTPPTDRSETCQDGYLPLPAGAILAPDTRAIRYDVIAKHAWGTHVVVVENGNGYNTDDYDTAGNTYGSSNLLTQGNTYAVSGCSLRILYERDGATTTTATATTTTTTTTATTTTTYIPKTCHGVTEPAACGARIPTGDCFAGGEHQTFAEKSCPAMCGLVCSSTTTTDTSTTTTTATTKTITTSTSTITTTTKTTVTTFTTTTVLALNANCNPRDDRCDAQEGLSCDAEHNECRHAEAVVIPPFLQGELDRLIKDAVDSAVLSADAANDRDMAALTASKDADIATLKSSKDADIAALTAAIHEKEILIVTAKANLTVCSTKLEARRLVRLANAAVDLEALSNGGGANPTDPCAGQTDPPECDLWTTDQCGTVLFGNVNVTAECTVLCDNCVSVTPQEGTTNGAAVGSDASASASASGNNNSTLFLSIGICAGIVVLATVINIMIRRSAADQEDGHNSNAGAFVNPMYDEKNSSQAGSGADPHVYGGNSALQDESYEEISGATNSNSTYDAAGAADEEGHYDGLVGNGTYDAAAGEEDTYEDVVGGGADSNYLNVGNDDFNC